MRGALLMVLVACAANAQDLLSGKDVYGPCAACHGANAEGGKGGEYPRLAGMPVTYLMEQLKAFQERKRTNIPMAPYTEPRELPDRDMKDVAAYLSSLVIPVTPPDVPETASALEKLEAMQKVLVVPKTEGDLDKGKTVYKRRCAGCHGSMGQGKVDFPRLTNQWPKYLQRQFEKMRAGERPHEGESAESDVLKRVKDEELTNIVAWLTSIQSQPPPEAEANADAQRQSP